MLATLLSAQAERAYALMRIVAGLMFSFHGMQKVFGVLSDKSIAKVGEQVWIGGVIELVCGLAIAVGLLTWLAAFLASGTMAVAYAQFHWKFQMGADAIPTINGGELALLYAFVFLYIACKGSGIWSVDARRGKWV